MGTRERATLLLILTAVVLGGGGVIIAVGLMVFAPFLIELIFGSAFVAEGVPILRILVLLIPLNILGVVAGGWLLSLRLEHVVVRFVLVAGVLNVILGVILTPLFGPEGMAVSVVIAELAAATGAVITLYRSERNEQVRVLPRLRVRRSAAPEPGRSPVG